ncbi:Peptidase M23 [Desulfurobacterium thermolithotrophum DSM 11699]|uniref:Peptidase M23 n=1 Tax=Desulfurobacterium thermolithotrophum (strain DSM 11699 / BSA) TaxID=868864 RepID=F0S3F2_DESTD|nr:M23 family metallopeptidase [Desulfurobacterium thermolithotrophum]ADY73374.1 Peptidase M23 [Desulfurobacterium thermolithotrophum DSM 11699]
MKDSKLQVIVIDSDVEKPKRYRISKKKIKVLAIASLFFTTVLLIYTSILTYKSYSYYSKTEKEIKELKEELAQYKSENGQLKVQLAKLKDEKEKTIEELAKRIEIIDSIMKKVGINVLSTNKEGEGGLAIPIEKLLTTNENIDLSPVIPDLDYIIQNLKTTPLGYPTVGRITSGFGLRRNPITGRIEFHLGVDIANTWGTPVRASADGKVIKAGWCGLMGKCIVIKHNKDFSTYYGHLAKIFVKKGEYVEKGQIIGITGNSGRSTGPHLHYTIKYKNKIVNPIAYMEVSP